MAAHAIRSEDASQLAHIHMPRGEILGRTGHVVRSLEHLAAPRKGTQCALLSREVLVAASETDPAVHRLRFAWPSTFGGAPSCCEGADGVIHVHVRAPAPDGVFRKNLSRSVPRIRPVASFCCLHGTGPEILAGSGRTASW